MFGFVAGIIVFAAGPAARSAPEDAASQASSLTRAVALFAEADKDHDGKLSSEESRAIPVSAEAFGAEDVDRDGVWSRDEFLIFYRHQLVASRQPVGADLEAEITRIQALRRVESADQAKKPKCETSARSADAKSVNQRFEAMLADVESKCAGHRAGRDDFQRLRNLVVLNGRAASRDSTAPASDTQSAMLAAIDRIEKRSSTGQIDKEDFELLRTAASACHAPDARKPKPTASTEAPKTAAPRSAMPPEPPKPATAAPRPDPTPPSPPPVQAGPAAARQRSAPPAPPKPQPRPASKPPASDPQDRSKP